MSKILKGGNLDNPYLHLKVFISMIILGYFGVKIVYGLFFNFYPQKFYYKNLEINTSDSFEASEENKNTKTVSLNAYMPGVWNTEITDFTITVILSLIIYIYTNMSTRAMITNEGNLHTGLLIGYIIGLGYPPFQRIIEPLIKTSSDNNLGRKVLLCLSWGLFIMILVTIIIVNYMAIGGDYSTSISYTTFISVIVLFIFGLFLARKKQETVSPVNYYFSSKEQCKVKKRRYLMSSGEVIKLTPTFAVFILLLLFSYDPVSLSWKYIYIMAFGLMLGVFVSGLSYYGIEYFLIKEPIKECNSAAECNYVLNEEDYEGKMEDELAQANNKNKDVNIVKAIMIVALIVVIAYLFMSNRSKII